MPSSGDREFPGWFFDGRSAAKHRVDVSLSAEYLTVRDAAGDTLAAWPLGDVSIVDPPGHAGPVRLQCGTAPDARLQVDDTSFHERLIVAAPDFGMRFSRQWLNWRHVGLATCAAVILVIGIVYGIPKMSAPLAAVVPVAWESKLGASIKAKVTATMPVCTSDKGSKALNDLVQRLTANLDLSIPLDIAVVKGKIKNAFALPGGHVMVVQGLLESLETPEELAGIIAHEIGHAVERHALAGIIRLAGLSLLLRAIVGGGSDVVDQVVQVGGTLIAFSYSRDNERDADRFALTLLEKAEISPRGLERFFTRLAAEETGKGTKRVSEYAALFSTHPWSEERLQLFRAAQVVKYRGVLSEEQWFALSYICR